ncbi:MAG: hypothetical protein R3C97_13755 [Geminicoccaceae bacterium]
MSRLSAIALAFLLPLSSEAAELESRVYWNLPFFGGPSALTLELGQRDGNGFRPEMARLALDGSTLDVAGLRILQDGEARLGADVDVSLTLWSILGVSAGVAVGFAIATDSVCLSFNSSCDDDDDDDDPVPAARLRQPAE